MHSLLRVRVHAGEHADGKVMQASVTRGVEHRPKSARGTFCTPSGSSCHWRIAMDGAAAPDRDSALRDCFVCARHRMASGPDASAFVTRNVLRRKSVTGCHRAPAWESGPVESVLFLAGLVVVACCVLCGLYFVPACVSPRQVDTPKAAAGQLEIRCAARSCVDASLETFAERMNRPGQSLNFSK
jgi:hypothetical protein